MPSDPYCHIFLCWNNDSTNALNDKIVRGKAKYVLPVSFSSAEDGSDNAIILPRYKATVCGYEFNLLRSHQILNTSIKLQILVICRKTDAKIIASFNQVGDFLINSCIFKH